MALEAVVYPQPQDPFGYGIKDPSYNYNNLLEGGGGNWGFEKEEQGFVTFLEKLNNSSPYGDSLIYKFCKLRQHSYACQ